MTKEEFDKITSIKDEIDNLEKIIYSKGDLETFIKSLNVINSFYGLYGINQKITEVKISKEFSAIIKNIAKERLEKLKIEFNNFKIK